MHVTFLTWAVTALVVVGLILFDFFAHVRKEHEPSIKEAAWWSGFYVALALLFAGGVYAAWGSTYAGEYLAGWVTEKSLSVDNLFVFLIIFASFGVKRAHQQKILLFGISFALVLRTLMILAGAALVEHFSWVFYLFGALLIYSAIGLFKGKEDASELKENIVLRIAKKILPTGEQQGAKLISKERGKRVLTPLAIAFVAIGTTDVLFALDSIPAIFGLTKEPYLVFAANAFALMGLRQMFFLIDGLLAKLVHLSKGLAFILVFIGVKLVMEALHENTLPFINSGEPFMGVPEIPTWFSLMVIFGSLTITVVSSLISQRRLAEPTCEA